MSRPTPNMIYFVEATCHRTIRIFVEDPSEKVRRELDNLSAWGCADKQGKDSAWMKHTVYGWEFNRLELFRLAVALLEHNRYDKVDSTWYLAEKAS